MSRKSLFEKANYLVELAKKEKDQVIRQLRLNAAERYYDADVSKAMAEKPGSVKAIFLCILIYLTIFVTVFFTYRELGLISSAGIFIVTYAFVTLLIGVFLRIRGDITENSFLTIMKEGFKALNLLKRSDNK